MNSNVLFITKDKRLVIHFESILKNTSISIITTPDKKEAIKKVKKEEVDLILIHSDYLIEYGKSIIREFVYNSFMDNVPIVLVLSADKKYVEEKIFNSGISDFIKTDFTDEEIFFKFQSLVENKKKISSLEQSLIISASLVDNLESHLIDIDKLKVQIERQNKTLESQIEKKQELYAGNLHDLKAPFSSLLGNAQLLRQGYMGKLSEEQLNSVKVIEKSARKLLELIETYLDSSKFEDGRMDLYLNKVDVSFLIELAVKDLLVLIENKKLTLTTEVNPPLPKVQVDIDKIIRVLHNLVMNAVKNTSEGGTITIGAQKKDEEYVILSIKDTGTGISKENQKNIFDKYEQGGRNVSGSGLGLAICKDIIEEMHYGSIWVESEPGKGSVFYFTLPIEFKPYEAESLE